MKRILLGASAIAVLAACDDPTRPAEQSGSLAAPAVQQQYTVRDLGTFGGTIEFPGTAGWGSTANEVNEEGEVAGFAVLPSGEARAFLWRDGQGKRSLGTLGGANSRAVGLNDQSEVVGRSEIRPGSDVTRAFLWTEAGGMRGLGTLGGASSFANAINNRREIVGVSQVPNGDQRAFIWRPGRGMQGLGTLGGAESFARDINNATQVAGVSLNADGNDHAFLWTEAGGMQDLGTLGGPTSAATGISETGEVSGTSSTAKGTEEAFLWTRGGGMRSLGTLGDRRHAFVNEVNTHHRAAGGGFDRNDFIVAFLWTPAKGVARLPTLGGPRGQPEDINEFGQIVGTTETVTGELHATLWTPSAGSAAVASTDDGAPPEAAALSKQAP